MRLAVLTFALLALLLTSNPAFAQTPWFNTDWSFRREITVDNTGNAAKTDYQVKVELTSANFSFANAEADGSDIRFTGSDGETLLDFWREAYDSSGETATFWVKVPSVPSNDSTTIYIYYGNSGAADASSIADTFLQGHDYRTDPKGTFTGSRLVVSGSARYSGNPVAHTGGTGWKQNQVREPGRIVHNSSAPSGEEYVLIFTGRDASNNSDLGVAFGSSPTSLTDYVSNPVIPNAEDPYIALNTDGTPYNDGTNFYVFFERKSGTSQVDVGAARTQDFQTYEVWDGDSWDSDTSTHAIILAAGAAGEWDDQDTSSPVVIHDGSQFVMLYEGRQSGGVQGQIGKATANNPEGPWAKYAISGSGNDSDPIINNGANGTWNDAGLVPDDFLLDGSTYWLTAHGSPDDSTFIAGRYSTTDAPASWDENSFSAASDNPNQQGLNTVMMVRNQAGLALVAANGDSSGLFVVDAIGGNSQQDPIALISNEIGSTIFEYAQYWDSGNEQWIQEPQDPTDIAFGSVVIADPDAAITNNIKMVVRAKIENQTDNRIITFGLGAGTIRGVDVGGEFGEREHIPVAESSYLAHINNPDVDNEVYLYRITNDAIAATPDTGNLNGTALNTFKDHAFSLLSDGSLLYTVDGTTILAATDTTHASVANKRAFFGVGQTDSDLAAIMTVGHWYVASWDGEDPAQTLGSEEEAPMEPDPTPTPTPSSSSVVDTDPLRGVLVLVFAMIAILVPFGTAGAGFWRAANNQGTQIENISLVALGGVLVVVMILLWDVFIGIAGG